MFGAYHARMDGIGWAAGAMAAAQTRLDTAAQNLANGSTDGFRRVSLRGRMTAAGIELRRVREETQGALRHTGRPFDLALAGAGCFRVRTAQGRVAQTRAGAFSRDRFGRLADDRGRVLLGRSGALRVPQGARLEASGAVVRGGVVVDRLPLEPGTSVRAGFLESSNVDAIGEMIDVLAAQRSYETAEKVLASIDSTRERGITQVGAIKG